MVRLAQGDARAALADALACSRACSSVGFENPAGLSCPIPLGAPQRRATVSSSAASRRASSASPQASSASAASVRKCAILSIAAAYGVVALVAEGGWAGRLIGIDTETPVPAFIPVMMFAIVFGLSMDYEVFLVSRVREEFLRHRDAARAVADGVARSARGTSPVGGTSAP